MTEQTTQQLDDVAEAPVLSGAAMDLIRAAHVSRAADESLANISSLKGLAARHEGVRKSDVFPIDPRLVQVEVGFNLRDLGTKDRQRYIRGLAESFKRGDPVPPISVRVEAGRIILVEGECRLTGALIAVAEGSDALMVNAMQHKGNEVDRLATMLQTGQDKNPLTVLECAMGIKRFSGWNMTPAAIAARIGKTPQHVEQMLVLANAPLDVQQMVQEGLVAAATAVKVVREHGDGAGEVLRAGLQRAKEVGRARVTPAHVSAPKVPPRLAKATLASAGAVVSALSAATRRKLAELESASPETLQSAVVEVPAHVLLELVRAQGAVDEAMSAKQQAMQDSGRAASQQSLMDVA